VDINTLGHGETAGTDIAICRRIHEVLEKHFPGYDWIIEANSDNTVLTATIKLAYTDNLGRLTRFGCLMHLKSYFDAESERKIMQLGGELLERCGLSRKKANRDTRLLYRLNGMDTGNAIR